MTTGPMTAPVSIQKTLESLEKNYVTGHFVESGAEALELIKPSVASGVVVASGNSLTLRQTGIFDYLASDEHAARFINQFEPGLPFDENRRRKKEGLGADVYVSGANALTEDGKICCLDGGGNRVAAILFGPDNVFIVVGRNKIVKNEAAAWKRIRQFVSPQTAVLLGRDLPCVADGKCHDCADPARFCRYYVTVNGQMERDKDRIVVIIIDQDLGL
jgi:L-lactate utilization protein LutB